MTAQNGSGEKNLTQRQRRFVAALLDGAPNVPSAAQAAGVGVRTAWQYMSLPAVRATVAERAQGALAQVAGGLADDAIEARAVLRAIMTDEQIAPGVRVRAAQCVIEATLKLAELVTMAERMANIESQLAERGN